MEYIRRRGTRKWDWGWTEGKKVSDELRTDLLRAEGEGRKLIKVCGESLHFYVHGVERREEIEFRCSEVSDATSLSVSLLSWVGAGKLAGRGGGKQAPPHAACWMVGSVGWTAGQPAILFTRFVGTHTRDVAITHITPPCLDESSLHVSCIRCPFLLPAIDKQDNWH